MAGPTNSETENNHRGWSEHKKVGQVGYSCARSVASWTKVNLYLK